MKSFDGRPPTGGPRAFYGQSSATSLASIPNDAWTTHGGYDVMRVNDAGGTFTYSLGVITVNIPGVFRVAYTPCFNTSGTGRRLSRISVNGAELKKNEVPPLGSAFTYVPVDIESWFEAGDVITTACYQTSGAGLAVIGTATGAPGTTLSVAWIR